MRRSATLLAALPSALLLLAGCGADPAGPADGASSSRERELVVAAYTAPREAFSEVLPAFAASWKARTGEEVSFQESYQGSGTQSRAIVEGFEADVAALSLEPDVARIAEAGLIGRDANGAGLGSTVTTSLVVIAVRPGNPKGIRDWSDLARPDVEVLTPNVRTSGGAMWNVLGLWGAAMRGHAGVPAGDAEAARALLAGVLKNVRVMDKGARESMLSFEGGLGDAAITYENEVLVARRQGRAMDYVVPSSTIVIENPVAVVDGYARRHGALDLAGAFVEYLKGSEAQRAFAAHGFRPVDPAAMPEGLPAPRDAFTVRDLGGWDRVARDVFGAGGAYERALADAAGRAR